MLKKLFALKNKKGFTLVELMVVVAIIGILTLVAVPVYNNVTDNAKNKTCDANVRTIESALMQYSIEQPLPKDQNKAKLSTLASLSPNYLQELPKCPWDEKAATPSEYVFSTDANGKVTSVECTSAIHHPTKP